MEQGERQWDVKVCDLDFAADLSMLLSKPPIDVPPRYPPEKSQVGHVSCAMLADKIVGLELYY